MHLLKSLNGCFRLFQVSTANKINNMNKLLWQVSYQWPTFFSKDNLKHKKVFSWNYFDFLIKKLCQELPNQKGKYLLVLPIALGAHYRDQNQKAYSQDKYLKSQKPPSLLLSAHFKYGDKILWVNIILPKLAKVSLRL